MHIISRLTLLFLFSLLIVSTITAQINDYNVLQTKDDTTATKKITRLGSTKIVKLIDSAKKLQWFSVNSIFLSSSFQFQQEGFNNQLTSQNFSRNNLRFSYSIFGIPLQSTANFALENGKFSYGLNRFTLSFDKSTYQNEWKNYTDDLAKNNDVAKKEVQKKITQLKFKQDSVSFILKRTTDIQKKQILTDTLGKGYKTDSLKEFSSEVTALVKQHKDYANRIEKLKLDFKQYERIDSLKKLKKINPSDVKKYSKKKPSFMQEVLSNVHTFEVGSFFPRYSKLMLQGIVLKGVNMEAVLGNFYVAFTTGGYSLSNPFNMSENPFQKKVNDGTIQLYRFGIGRPENSHLYLSFLKSTNKKPIETKTFYNGNEIVSGSVFNIEAKHLLSKQISISGEYSNSFARSHINFASQDATTGSEQKVAFAEPNAANTSFVVKASGIFSNTKIEIEGTKIGNMYYTLGNPFLRNDNFLFKSTLTQSVWKKHIQFSANIIRMSDNLSSTKAYSTVTQNINLSLRFQYKRLPQVIFSFAPSQSKGFWRETNTMNLSTNTQRSIMVLHMLQWKEAKINLSINNSHIEVDNRFSGQKLYTAIITTTSTATINYKKMDISTVLFMQENKGLLHRKVINQEVSVMYTLKGFTFGGLIGAGKDDYIGKKVLLGLKANGRFFKDNQVQLALNKTYFISPFRNLMNPLLFTITLTQKF